MKDTTDITGTCKISVLLYHQIGKAPHALTNLDCFCTVMAFYEQMEYLKHSGCKVIPLEKAMEMVSAGLPADFNYVVLTFDDGCEKFYDLAYPVLDEFSYASTVYPVTGFFGRNASWGARVNPDLKILSEGMVKELSALGVEIGAHTMDHVRLTQVENAEAIRQVKGSKEALEQLLGKGIRSFAYPHGDFNKTITGFVKEAGFSNAVTCVPGRADQAGSGFEIPRNYITYYDDFNTFKQKVL